MAVAARPGPSDARVPCPLCGGLIHPIAGKCKHCKADLSTYHAARPAANAPLPALLQALPVNDPPRPLAGGGAPRHAPLAYAFPIAAPREVPPPVLPPRPTSRGHAPEAGGWRSWPILVILVATVAIVIAAVLMVWPSAHDDTGKRVVQPPAPDRMDTQNPGQGTAPRQPRTPATPPGAAPDPWRPTPAVPDPAAPDDDQDLDSMADPFAAPHGAPTPRGRRKLAVNGRGMVMFAMAEHLCRKMVQCGNDDSTMAKVCDSVSTNATDLPANCPAAERCLQHIDAMACSAQGDDLSQLSRLLSQFRDCADAVRC
jgi:hypothetical protein